MRMELIQQFINAADAVFAESLQAPTKILDLSMDEETYRRKGVAALIAIKGDIEGRVILDLSPEVAMKVASHLAGEAVPSSDQVVRETVCELANMVIGKGRSTPVSNSVRICSPVRILSTGSRAISIRASELPARRIERGLREDVALRPDGDRRCEEERRRPQGQDGRRQLRHLPGSRQSASSGQDIRGPGAERAGQVNLHLHADPPLRADKCHRSDG